MDFNEMQPQDELNSILIDAVEQVPLLYEPCIYGQRMKKERSAAWMKISEILNTPIEECKRNWTNLRDRFCKELNKEYDKRGVRTGYKSDWLFYENLKFLEPLVNNKNNTPLQLGLVTKTPRSCLPSHAPRKRSQPLDSEDNESVCSPRSSECHQTDSENEDMVTDELANPCGTVPSENAAILPANLPPVTSPPGDGSFSTVITAIKSLQAQLTDHQALIRQRTSIDSNQEDAEYFFGMSIACRLRQMTPSNKALAQAEIEERLLQIEHGSPVRRS